MEVPIQVQNKPVALLHSALQDKIITSYQSVYGELPVSIGNPVVKFLNVPQAYGDQLYTTRQLTEDDDIGKDSSKTPVSILYHYKTPILIQYSYIISKIKKTLIWIYN